MKYLRRQNLNLSNVLDKTVLQTSIGNIELNPAQKVTINGDLEFGAGASIPGPEVTNVMYVTLDGDDANSGFGEGPGQAKRTIKAACAVAQEGTTIYVRSGEYYEDNPIRIPPKVSIIGDNLRRTIVKPLNGTVTYDITNVSKTNEYVTITTSAPHGLVLRDRVRIEANIGANVSPGFFQIGKKYRIVSTGNTNFVESGATNNRKGTVFVATNTGSIGETGLVVLAEVDETDVNIYDVPTPTTFRYRQTGTNIVSTASTGTVKKGTDLFLVNSQNFLNNMVFKSLPAPAYCINIDSDAIVDTSPYVQNCSNINGPWMRNGQEWLPFITEQPDLNGNMVTGPRPLLDDEIDPLLVDQFGIDERGSGGGMLIDGDRYSTESPIKSMVADAFTQVAQGAIGFHITNFGYMQLVSCFAVFCDKAFYTTRGGYLSISNSVIDFGNQGFVAEGYYPDTYGSGLVTQNYYSSVASITVTPGAGYTSVPSVLIDPPTTPGGIQATATASIDTTLGIVNAITVDNPGSGYDFQPTVTISGGGATINATAVANLQKNLFIEVSELSNKPQIGSIMFLENDPQSYYVTNIEDDTFNFSYDEQKCRRDVGIILDAVLADLVFESNYRSVTAGLSYLRSYSSKVTSLQKTQTIAGLTQAKNSASALTSDPTALAAITLGFNTVINIINFGSSLAPSIVNNYPTTTVPGYPEASDILLANKTFIEDELINWISTNYPALSYNEATCRRDIRYIVDALCYDLMYGGNSQTVGAALAYKEGSVIAGEVEETQDTYEYWKTIIGKILKNEIVPTTTPGQVTTSPLGSPVDPNGPATTAEDLLQIIIDVLDHGPGYIPDPVTQPFYANGDPAALVERNLILAETANIQEDVINYLNNVYGGSSKVYTFPAILSVEAGSNANFYNVSTISTGGTALEYVGAGVTYNALPFFGGEPIPAQERIEINNGKCFTVSNDQVGNYRIGEFFTVNALTGEVTIDAERLNLSGLASIGPFRRNGIPVGVQLREVSNNANLVSSTGSADPNTVPTQPAVQIYVENRYLNKVGTAAQTVNAPVSFTNDVDINGGDLYSTATTFNLLNRDSSGSIGEDGPDIVNAFLNATEVNIGATTGVTTINHDLAIEGQIVDTTQTTVKLFNTNATTVEAFGAATDITFGASTGSADFNSQTINFPNATAVNIDGVNPTIASTSTGTLTLFDTLLTTVNAFRAATTINIGESTGTLTIGSANTVLDGDLQVKGGDITTNQTTFNLLNTTTTTANAFGAATTLNLAAGSGTTTVNNNLQVNLNTTLGVDATSSNIYWGTFTANIRDNTANSLEIKEATNSYIKIDTSNSNELTTFGSIAKVSFGNTTDASSTTVASTTFAGGVGIAKKLYVGTDLNVEGNVTLGNDRTTDAHAVNGTLVVNLPDDTAIAFQVKENTQTYITAVTTNGSESITVESTPKLLVKNTTDSTDKDTGAVIIEGGVGIEKNLNVGVDLGVGRDVTITGDLSVNGGDLTTTATTFNLLNTTATTINFGGAATDVQIGAATGTTSINNNLDVDGDVNIDGGDLTVSTATFNLANTTVTTGNLFGTATAVNVGTSATATSVLTFGSSAQTNNEIKINSQSSGAAKLTSGVTTGSVDIFTAVTGTTNIASSGDIKLGSSSSATTTVTVGGAITGNNLKIAGTTAGTVNLTTDVTTGSANIFTGVTGNINIGAAGTTVNIGETTGNSTLEVRGNSSSGVATLSTNSGTTTANIFNTNVTTVNIAGAATDVQIGAATGTTNVNNNLTVDGDLQVKGGDITTDQTTFNLLNTTATTVNAFGAATDVQIGAATGTTNVNNNLTVDGDLQVKGGDITTDQTTFNIVNATATTVNAFGAATDVQIGAATGTTNINNDLDVDGDVNIDGGDLTTSAGTFNLLNTTATTINFGGAATAITIGFADSLALTTIKHDLKVDGDLTVDGTLNLGNDVTIAGDLAVNGGDLTSTSATFNLLNGTVTTLNIGGAATDVQIGAATGTTNINNDLDVDGDINFDGGDITSSAVTVNILAATSTTVNAFGAATALNLGAATGTTIVKNNFEVDLNTTLNGTLQVDSNATITGDLAVNGGDITTNQTSFNLLNTVATTVDAFGVATAVNIGTSAAAASTLTYGPAITGNTFKLAGTATGTVNYTTDVTTGTVNAWQSVTGIVNVGKSGTINIGNSTTATTAAVVGGAITGNSLKIASTAAGAVTLNSDVTTGTVGLFNNVTTGTVNIAGAGASTINLGGTGSTVNAKTLTLTTDLEVQYGGTGRSTFTENGVIFGNNADGLLVTAASNPGSNAITSYGILTTDINNVPVWTDVIDGGSY